MNPEWLTTGAKLAGALNCIAQDRCPPEPAFTVAYLKRALNHLHKSQAALERLAKRKKLLLPEKLEAYASQTITDRRILLKELAQVREQGFAIIDNELEEELLSLSRPIRDSSGTMVAVMSLNGPRYRFTRDRIPGALEQMQLVVDRLADVFWQDSALD